MDIGEPVNVLIEVSSGRDLMVGDIKTSDPYVVCCLGQGEEMHRTKHIPKTLNPKWGAEDNNTFLLDCPVAKLLDQEGLFFVVRDFDMVSKDDSLGHVFIKAKDIRNDSPTASTFERKITPPKGIEKDKDCGHLTIRLRKASPEDIASIQKGEKKNYFWGQDGVFDEWWVNE